MALTQAVKQLKKEQQRLQSELDQIDNALETLNHLFGKRGRRRAANGRRGPRRRMSAAARRRIAAAQRARWAKLKAKKSSA
jgi:hypothetical protein